MSGKHTLNAWRFLCQIEAGEYCTGEAGPKYGRRGLAQTTRVGAVRPTFRENRVDTDLLPKLTADDLKDLGIALVEAQMVSSRKSFC